jgi:N-dimethylarginine dimethylaminohydrolase
MKLIPEYEPVQKICLCFVQDFFNSRFRYGKTICEIIRAVQPFCEVEVLVSEEDLPQFEEECKQSGVTLENVTLNHDSPGRSIMAEYVPIFARDESGAKAGLVFRNPLLDDEADGLEAFGRRMAARPGFRAVELGFEFATAHLLVNDELVLLSDHFFRDESRDKKLGILAELFPGHSFQVVPPLTGDLTTDLDMYLWPIAPKAWIVSEYAAHTPQADSIEPALRALKEHGHEVWRVPGLEPIVYDDINTMPNYANGVIINRAALVPAYGRKEDAIVAGILKDRGYQVLPIDCTDVILTNSGIHCISKTIPV